MENCIYLKTAHLNTKNVLPVDTKDINTHIVDLEREIMQKIKNGYSLLLNRQQLKKYKENI